MNSTEKQYRSQLRNPYRNRGFGMIELLITLGILGVGIVGVATFHSQVTQQGQDNRARSEAFSIAQSRIEEMRNYTANASSQEEFDALYADTDGFANTASINGVHANFTRSESITTSGDRKDVTLLVNWSSPDGENRDVTLSTELAFRQPRSVGDVARRSGGPLVNPPTGRARLGEGVLPEGAETTSNLDGTALYEDGGGDLMLAVDDQIVLTLALACQTDDGVCLDFVRISGRVYIDTATQNNLNPGDVSVVASDAAFCARYYVDNGVVHRVTPATATALSTPGGDYDYFDYTCYIGGGWHGNVGLILAGGLSQQDKVCVGDPTDELAGPAIATRRAYRGMLYRHDDSTTSGREEMTGPDGSTLIRYFSHGIADSIELPEPGTQQRGHDFVIGRLPPSANQGSDCITRGIMVRDDATVDGVEGGLFSNLVADFVCLNPGYLDDYDTSIYGNDEFCPYDPTNPPSSRHIVSGSIAVALSDIADNRALLDDVNALTSDGPRNCMIISGWTHDGNAFRSEYSCNVYDWGNGWTGSIGVAYADGSISCDPNQISFNRLRSDSSGNDFAGCLPSGTE